MSWISGFGFCGNYFPEFQVGLSVQMMRESGCESRGQISVSTEGVQSIWTEEYATEVSRFIYFGSGV